MNKPSIPSSTGLVKVFFELEHDDHGYPPADVESVWATSLGGDLYRIENCSFFALGVSYHDVVRADRRRDGILWFDKIQEASGHSNLHVIVFEQSPDPRPFDERMRALQDNVVRLGCRFEGSHLAGLFSIDVPPGVSLASVILLLEQGEQAGLWGYQEASIAHIQ